MKNFLLVLLVSLSTYVSAKPFKAGPIWVQLSSARMIRDEGYKPCWQQNNVFDTKTCRKKISSCQLDIEVKNPNKINAKLDITKNREVDLYRSDEKTTGKGFSYEGGNAYLNISEIPVGTDVTAYKVEGGNKYNIYLNTKISDTTNILTMNPALPIKHKVRFFANKEISTYATELQFYFFDEELRHITQKNNPFIETIELNLPDGDYSLKGYMFFKNARYDLNKTISLRSGMDTNLDIELNPNDFVLYQNKEINELGLNFTWDGSELKSNDYSYSLDSGFAEYPEAKIDGLNVDLKEYFDLINGRLKLKDSKITDFKNLTKSLPMYHFLIKGECAVFYNYEEKKLFDIYSSSDKKVKLGELFYIFDTEGNNLNFVKDNKYYKFESNLESGSCAGFTHQPYDKNGKMVDLGKGPWGNSGWIEAKANSIFDRDMGYETSDRTWAHFKKENGKIIEYGLNQKLPESGSEFNYSKEIKESDIIDSDGKIKVSINCDYGC